MYQKRKGFIVEDITHLQKLFSFLQGSGAEKHRFRFSLKPVKPGQSNTAYFLPEDFLGSKTAFKASCKQHSKTIPAVPLPPRSYAAHKSALTFAKLLPRRLAHITTSALSRRKVTSIESQMRAFPGGGGHVLSF